MRHCCRIRRRAASLRPSLRRSVDDRLREDGTARGGQVPATSECVADAIPTRLPHTPRTITSSPGTTAVAFMMCKNQMKFRRIHAETRASSKVHLELHSRTISICIQRLQPLPYRALT
eukprot:3991613-Pleurochrysis_carterae.AAC.5